MRRMELATLDVSQDQAREALIHYRAARKLNRNAEDDAIIRGYNQIMKGRRLIELSQVIKAGGADERGRPRLAIMRADQRTCECTVSSDGMVVFGPRWARHVARSLRIELPSGTLPPLNGRWVNGSALLPSVPPQHRPADSIANYHILWEAEWTDVPKDPALLKHIGGDLYAVLAVWDLSPLEMAVLRGRLGS